MNLLYFLFFLNKEYLKNIYIKQIIPLVCGDDKLKAKKEGGNLSPFNSSHTKQAHMPNPKTDTEKGILPNYVKT